MPYSVVEIYKKTKSGVTEFASVPPGWIDQDNKILYWPRIDYGQEIANENSVKQQGWIPRILKKVWHTGCTWEEAENMVHHHVESRTSSEASEVEEEGMSNLNDNIVSLQ